MVEEHGLQMPEVEYVGLSAQEVQHRIDEGAVNITKEQTSRSTMAIIRSNIFTLFNGIIFAAMVLVLITGSWKDAVFGFVIIVNAAIGVLTELRAKRTLDKLSILVSAKSVVRRDSQNIVVDHADIVQDDLLWIRSGEQVPADAIVVQDWNLELDESMLTGESVTVRKAVGEQVFSGSTAVSGLALVRVNAVGENSYVARLTAEAKVYKKTISDLNRGINTILKYMTYVVVPLCVLLIWSQLRTVGGWSAFATGEWKDAFVSSVAGIVGMIPEGLVLLTSLNFAVAAMRLARQNTLVQELESVETLARVDSLNLDKTGTITDGGIAFRDIIPLSSANEIGQLELYQAIFDVVNEESVNATAQAIIEALSKENITPSEIVARIPFSSARKWSAVIDKHHDVWYFGAPEVIVSSLASNYDDVLQKVNDFAAEGNRVLLICKAAFDGDIHEFSNAPKLQSSAKPIALILCAERVRDDAQKTLQWFREQGVRCRIISGDNPVTVGAIAHKVQLTGDDQPMIMDARELPEDINELAQTLEHVDVLGRVLPNQKKAIVQA
ncbi:MAG: HAD-IC family P-type ATPase, partial [Bifidobacteriaceae bacterium]|nr:HAD-IC family P-type ATPase [Bifidobacteriaceae bacterium]